MLAPFVRSKEEMDVSGTRRPYALCVLVVVHGISQHISEKENLA
jgi:hypothetical protein